MAISYARAAPVAVLLISLLAAAASAQQAGTIIPFSKAPAAELAKNLASQPIVFIANIKLKPGTDVNKWIATREGVVARVRKQFNFPFSVAYFKGALPAKTETLPQGAAKLEYWPVGVIVTMPDAKSYAAYNAAAAKDPEYVSSGKSVEAVVRSVNLQM